MRIFLIDYENVNSCGLAGISRLNAEDRVILFYSQSANTLNFDILDEIMQSPVRTEKVNLNQSGKNALDFQLVTYLGYLIARQEADDFYIISRDMGYVATQQFCKKMLGVKVQIKPSIRDALTEKNVGSGEEDDRFAAGYASAACSGREQAGEKEKAEEAAQADHGAGKACGSHSEDCPEAADGDRSGDPDQPGQGYYPVHDGQ